jgi:hypothetical protein
MRTEENNLFSVNAVFGTTVATITMNTAHSHIEHGVHRNQIVLLCSHCSPNKKKNRHR